MGGVLESVNLGLSAQPETWGKHAYCEWRACHCSPVRPHLEWLEYGMTGMTQAARKHPADQIKSTPSRELFHLVLFHLVLRSMCKCTSHGGNCMTLHEKCHTVTQGDPYVNSSCCCSIQSQLCGLPPATHTASAEWQQKSGRPDHGMELQQTYQMYHIL